MIVKGAALSDLHLGYRAYQAIDGGRNARELDVERAWNVAVGQIVEYGPHIVTIAGDIFHHPQVSTHAVKAFREGVRRLAETGAWVIILQGNHDAPKSAGSLSPIVIPDDYERVIVVMEPGVMLLDGPGPESWPATRKEPSKMSVACFPFVDRTLETSFRLDYDPDADLNILAMHAEVKGSEEGDALPYFYGHEGVSLDVGTEAERWDVIHCGDYHEATKLHPTRCAFYPGSIERTSSNIWAEKGPKFWAAWEWDGSDVQWRFEEIGALRPMQDIGFSEYGAPSDAEGLNGVLAELLEDEIDGHIVRLVVRDFPRTERTRVDWGLVRKLKQKALHFQPDIRYVTQESIDLGDRRDEGAPTGIIAQADAFFADDDEDVRTIAIDYLNRAGAS